ncbi:hypothetical protein JWV37_00120 [Sulfurospirillum sp. T05]|uniref:DUF4325 domain-containing protein n=1 Tax=Sulfurospirillum tamanense TaxID=2813362 RepID=A0ABS2WNK6_9BACT|nr:hypothetical protein [Sulfurospirillum tamanensis]MBN2963171.1 hypothetical protein [Sulfurospirillum tamanensis]
MTTYEKYIISNNARVSQGLGELFDPRTAHKFYGVDFIEDGLLFGIDFETRLSCVIDSMGASPWIDIFFTDLGIKKLLKKNKKMRQYVKEIYAEMVEDGAL